MIDGYQYMPSTGWVCPKCGNVYAPWVSKCNRCGNVEVVTTNATIGKLPDEYIKQFMIQPEVKDD